MSQSHVLRATTRSVDLGESFPTSIYLEKSASIQPRTSSSKFYSILFNIIQYYSFVSLGMTGRITRTLSI